MKRVFLIFCTLLFLIVGFGQLHHHEEHAEHAHYHFKSKLGFGAASALIYDLTEKEFAPGFHIHVLKYSTKKLVLV